MTYKIIDNQNQTYFSEGEEFGSLREVCDCLINYHETDTDMSEERKLGNEKKYEECWGLLTIYDGELEEIEKPIENDFDIFTTKELKAMLYHTEYDKETILSNHDLEDYKLGFTIEDSESAIEKLKNILKNRNENL